MSAKRTLRDNKTKIQSILLADVQLILDKVYEKDIITERNYDKIKSSTCHGNMVVEIVDTIRNRGETKCQDFLELLKTDKDIKDNFPPLQDIDLNYTVNPPRPRQDTSSVDNRDCQRRDEALSVATGDSDDETEYYALTHDPRGWCVIINIENFTMTMRPRKGSQEDIKALSDVFTRLGFKLDVVNDLTADEIRTKLHNLGKENFQDHDALVVCVLSNGEKGVIYGSDERQVSLEELTKPFTGDRAPTLAGKPKLFFIQACQGSDYQRGVQPYPRQPGQRKFKKFQLKSATQGTAALHDKADNKQDCPEEEPCGQVSCETVASNADFLMGMATLPGYLSFRNTKTGSIYIQELCRQLKRSAESSKMDDILTILTRVNREVTRQNLSHYKQMPQPMYTLTKRLILKFV